MRALPLLVAASFLAIAVVPTAQAWFPVCKEWEVSGPYVTVHVGLDCGREIYVETCPPIPMMCQRYDVLP